MARRAHLFWLSLRFRVQEPQHSRQRHSLPYSRIGATSGVYFIDASALTRFFQQPYFRIKVPHRIGPTTLLHRTAIKKL
jgi:hypothetical protein